MIINEKDEVTLRNIGSRLRRVRKLYGMTQSQVGKRLGLSGQQVCKYEFGQDQVSILLALKYATLFKMSIYVLFHPSDTI